MTSRFKEVPAQFEVHRVLLMELIWKSDVSGCLKGSYCLCQTLPEFGIGELLPFFRECDH
jgi:hypothetical protein